MSKPTGYTVECTWTFVSNLDVVARSPEEAKAIALKMVEGDSEMLPWNCDPRSIDTTPDHVKVHVDTWLPDAGDIDDYHAFEEIEAYKADRG